MKRKRAKLVFTVAVGAIALSSAGVGWAQRARTATAPTTISRTTFDPYTLETTAVLTRETDTIGGDYGRNFVVEPTSLPPRSPFLPPRRPFRPPVIPR